MREKDVNIIKNLLGEDIFETLEKYEIYKPDTRSVVDPEEIKIALQIVPRSILSFLFANLKHRDIGAVIELDLPFEPGARLYLNKMGADNYKGELVKEGKRLAELKHRSLPSIGLIILTTFELYDMALLDEIKKDNTPEADNKIDKLQDIIDERLCMHKLIQDVVDKRISEREAISRLIKEKLHDHLMMANEYRKEDSNYMEEHDKKSKLKQFLESRENKRQEPVDEFDKSEIACPDCKNSLYKGEGNSIKLCICYGEHMGKDIKMKKAEGGRVKLKFPKSFDIDNIEMLLDALKNR